MNRCDSPTFPLPPSIPATYNFVAAPRLSKQMPPDAPPSPVAEHAPITTDGHDNVAPGAAQIQPEPLAIVRDLVPLPSNALARTPQHYPAGLVSSTFFFDSDVFPGPPDLILLSSDDVHFYVHSRQLLSESTNGFNSLITSKVYKTTPLGRILKLPEHSAVLNVVLHTMYGISCEPYRPDKDTLVSAIGALAKYGVSLKLRVASGMPLYSLILDVVPDHPIDFYAVAAEHGLHNLALVASTYLGTFPVAQLSNEQTERIGPRYLRKLLVMLEERDDMVKRLIHTPPSPHPPLPSCGQGQELLAESWTQTLATMNVAWNTQQYGSPQSIVSKLRPLGDAITCELCKAALANRLATLEAQLQALKCSI